MSNLLFLVAFLGLPVASYLITRNLTWTVGIVGGLFALVGAFVSFWADLGNLLTLLSLQFVLTGLFLLALALSFLVAPRLRAGKARFGFKRHLVVAFAPVVALLLFVLISRVLAASSGGLFTGVGFIITRQHAEDNAQWLDFSSQLIQGNEIVQAVPMGGPLQLFMVFMATLLSSISVLALGGVNEVFVASNSVIYGAYALAILAPLAFAPFVEFRGKIWSKGASGLLPTPVVWAGMLVLVVASLAASGLGHVTLQFVLLGLVFWVGVFLLGSRIPHAWAIASLGVVGAAVVWFPLTPIAIVVLVAGLVVVVGKLTRRRSAGGWLVAGAWIAMIVFTFSEFLSAMRYITDTTTTASGEVGGVVGGIAAAAGSARVPTLTLLSSQGGTEQVSPSLSIGVVIAAVLAVLFLRRIFPQELTIKTFTRLAPGILLVVYALGLLVVGSWWSGDVPAYGALKSTFLVSIVILATAAPLAIMELDPRNRGRSALRFTGVIAIVYVLAVDGLMTRAASYVSPTQWPNAVNKEGNYWWPAEVRSVADQPLATNPIGCAYYPQGSLVPTAIPDGQRAYACTRLLVGLAGLDNTAQPIIEWLKREWFTNTPAWLETYPQFAELPPEVTSRQLILLDELNNVVGLETVGFFMDRYKPDWAKAQ